jgi:hypothetical protein
MPSVGLRAAPLLSLYAWITVEHMPSPEVTPAPLPPRVYSPLAGVLSYLVPGLGQIYQGRLAKGILFFVCLYGLFFYGLYLGNGQNVYIETPAEGGRLARDQKLFQVFLDRARFLGQMWIGVAAWPAVLQYMTYSPREEEHPVLGKLERMPSIEELNSFLRSSDKTADLGWVYTVVAGVLNVLVIYDAFAGPAFRAVPGRAAEPAEAAPEGAPS